jgi:hypothetical protein
MKYKNKPCWHDDKHFDSIKECTRYKELLLLQHSGYISNLECQRKFLLLEKITSIKQRAIFYICDFYYYDEKKNKWICEDVKSPATKKNKVYCLKKKLLLAKYLGAFEFIET